MHREKPHKLLQVGVTPTPATNCSGKRSGCLTVNRVSENKVGSDELERYQRFPPFGLVAQLAERPVVCGRVEGATPVGSAILSECSSVFRALVAVRKHLGTGRPQVEILPFRPISNCCRGRIHEASVF